MNEVHAFGLLLLLTVVEVELAVFAAFALMFGHGLLPTIDGGLAVPSGVMLALWISWQGDEWYAAQLRSAGLSRGSS